MTYEYIRAEDYCESVRDGTHDTPKPVENGYKLVTGKHIRDGRIDPTEAYFISEKDYIKINERSKVDQWDVLMSMIGNGLGRSAVVDDNPIYAIKNIALFKVGDETKAKWLHYYLSGEEGQGRIYNSLQGSGQPFISLSYIRDFPVPNPPREIMKRVVGVLEQYDFLIDNNQKQIKLLEEAAQRLYKEWFVDLRFPGYENTPIVDGVPKGWEKCLLEDINCSLESGSRPKGGIDASLADGVPSIGAENVIGLGCYNYSSEKLITKDFFSKMKRGKLCDKDILIYKDGAYIGRTSLFQDGFPHLEAAVNEHVFLLHAADEHIQYYLFFTLYQQEYYQKMQKLNKNAAQPGINSKAMMSLPVLLPTEDILDGFDSFVTPLMHKIFNLAKQNRQLELARDRLLPKLISGEIEV